MLLGELEGLMALAEARAALHARLKQNLLMERFESCQMVVNLPSIKSQGGIMNVNAAKLWGVRVAHGEHWQQWRKTTFKTHSNLF